jgi:hypothetical protein
MNALFVDRDDNVILVKHINRLGPLADSLVRWPNTFDFLKLHPTCQLLALESRSERSLLSILTGDLVVEERIEEVNFGIWTFLSELM